MKPFTLLPAFIATALLLSACGAEDAQQQSEAQAPASEPAPTEDSQIAEKANRLTEDAKDLGNTVWERTKERTGQLVENGKKAIDDAADATGDALDSAKEKSAVTYEAVKEKGAAAYDAAKAKAAEALESAKEHLGSDTPDKTETGNDMPRKT